MNRITSLMITLALLCGVGNLFAQAPPSNAWEALDQAKRIFESSVPQTTGRTAISAHGISAQEVGVSTPLPSVQQQDNCVVLRSNIGEFTNASPSVEIRLDVAQDCNYPVFVSGRITKVSGNDYHTQGYFVPEGTMFGRYDRLVQSASYTFYKAAIPEAAFGDVYIFDAILTVPGTGQQIQFVSTQFIVGGDNFGHRQFYHLDDAVYQQGFLYLWGNFPQGQQAAIRLGDSRNNSVGTIYAFPASSNLITVPIQLGVSSQYAYPYDVVVYFPSLSESYTLPSGLKISSQSQVATGGTSTSR